MSILNVNKINPVGGGSTITIAGIASVTSSISASSFVGNPLLLQTGGSERLRITSDGNVLVGTTDSTTVGTVNRNLVVGSTTNNDEVGLTLNVMEGVHGRRVKFFLDDDDGEFGIDSTASTGVPHFVVRMAASERLRITNNGNLLIGSTNEANNIRLENKIGIVGTTAYTGMSITNYPGTNASHAGLFDFNRSRGTSDQSMTAVTASDKLGEIIFRGSNGSAFTDAATLRAFADTVSGSNVNGRFEISTALSDSMNVAISVNKEGYVTKPRNPVFHAFGGPSNVATNTDIVFGQERFDVGGGYNTSTGEYTAPATGYYHFYCQVYRQSTSNDSWWGFYLDTGSGYAQISESRLENDYGGDSGRGYCTLQSSIYWYMTAGHKIKCRVPNSGGTIHCNNAYSYFCGNLVG